MDFSWIDILIILILLLFSIRGFIQGFVKTFLSFAVVVASLVVAKLFAAKLTLYIKTNFGFYGKISQKINEKVMSIFQGNNATSDAVTDSNSLYNIPKGLQKFLDKFVEQTNNTIGTASDAFAKNAADVILSLLCFIAIFVAAILIGKLLVIILDKLAKLPILRSFNKLGGFLVGLIIGVVIVAIITTSIYYINVFLRAEVLSTAINNSFLIKYFYLGFLFT